MKVITSFDSLVIHVYKWRHNPWSSTRWRN